MKVKHIKLFTGLVLSVLLSLWTMLPFGMTDIGFAQAGDKLTKAEKIKRIRQGMALKKTRSFQDLKAGRMDNGAVDLYYTNKGMLGDREFTKSFEYPVGSGHFFLWQAGIMFGAVTASGDTITSDSYIDVGEDQFNPEPGFDNPDFIWEALGIPIIARSDIPRSFAPSWNGLWPSLDGGFIDPDILKNLARQESYWVMRDNNDPETTQPARPLNIEVESRFIQINSSLTKEIIFAVYKVKNIGTSPLYASRFGLLIDADMIALVGAEYEDDDAGFVKGLNLSWARDTDNFYASEPGVNIGYFGVQFLKSPEIDGKELGLTSWAVFTYNDMPGPGEYPLTPDGPDESQPPFKDIDHAQYQYMQPGLFMHPAFNQDVVMVMASGDFELGVGESVDMAVAFMGAPDFDALINNAIAARTVFDNNFVGPTAPIAPAVTAVPDNHTVTLYWDSEPTESSTDPLTGRADFEGYRIYRSDDRGKTWGEKTDNLALYPNGFKPVAEYDVVNTTDQLASIVVSHSNAVSTASIRSLGLADGTKNYDEIDVSAFFSNDNYQIIFDTDSTFQVLNTSQGYLLGYLDDEDVGIGSGAGFAVFEPDSFMQLYDNPDATHGLYRSGYPIYVTGVFVVIEDAAGSPVQAGDVFVVDQRKNDPGKNVGLAHSWTDPEKLLNGVEYWYTVAAYDRPDLELGVPRNENRPVTIASARDDDQTVAVIPQASMAGLQTAEADTLAEHIAGNSGAEIGVQIVDPRQVTGHTYEISFSIDGGKTYSVKDNDTGQLVLDGEPIYDPAQDNAKMFDGIRVLAADVKPHIDEDSTGHIGDPAGGTIALDDWEIEDESGPLTTDFEFRFGNTTYTYVDWDEEIPVKAKFAIFALEPEGERQIAAEIFDQGEGNGNGEWDPGEPMVIAFDDYHSDPHWNDIYTWKVYLTSDDPDGVIDAGNVFRIVTAKTLTSEDRYQFSTRAQNVNAAQAKAELDKIRVVPNPFVVTSGFDTVKDRHEVHFTRLPEVCSIKIFTLTGELVRKIEHDRNASGLNFARWDLKTDFGSEVAYGVYLYHIDAGNIGTKMGKLAIIR